MSDLKRPVANPTVVLREEFDDWAVLFDPDSGEAFGLDPVSVFIWRLLDGKHTASEIVKKLREACEDGVPEEAPDHLKDFIEDLTSKGLVGYAETI
jgi:SynChlorMet cassette protein ScmD